MSKYLKNEEVIVAIKDIPKGREITEDYSTSENDLLEDRDNVLNEIQKKFKLADELDPRLKKLKR
jgi:SET domain-containing protein